jgi:hypothetical protein
METKARGGPNWGQNKQRRPRPWKTVAEIEWEQARRRGTERQADLLAYEEKRRRAMLTPKKR